MCKCKRSRDEMAFSMITLHLWITFILTLTMGSGANGNGWAVKVRRHIDALRGSDVVIRCSFTHPSELSNDVKVFWKRDEKKGQGQKRENNNPFVFHPDSSKIIQMYSEKTSLVGNVHDGDCSLGIKNITHNESDLYVRVHAGDYYSFYTYTVSIKVTGATGNAVTIPPASEVTTEIFRTLPHVTSSTAFISLTESLDLVPTQSSVFPLHLVISVPIASVFTVGIVAFIVFLVYRKHGRSRQSLNRTTSGYYVNFSRSETKTKSELIDLTKSFPQDPQEVKAIEDDPVYSNLQSYQPSATSEMENIYANM